MLDLVDELLTQRLLDLAVAVERSATRAQARDQFASVRHHLGKIGDVIGRRISTKVRGVDLHPHNVTPVADTQATAPLVVGAVGFHTTATAAGGVFDGHLTLVFLGQAHLAALGVDAVTGVRTPDHKPDASVVGARRRCAAIVVVQQDVLVAFGSRGVEARQEAGELFGRRAFVAVEQRAGELLVHALQVGHVFRHAERSRVAVEVSQLLVHFGVGFHHADGVRHLDGLALRGLDAAVQLAPRRSREARADRGAVAGLKVALKVDHVLKDFVGLSERLDDRRDALVRILPLGVVKQRRVRSCTYRHGLTPQFIFELL